MFKRRRETRETSPVFLRDAQTQMQQYVLRIFRPGRREAVRLDTTTFVQSHGLQTRGQSQQEVRLQGRTREHEDLPLRSRQSREHESMG